VKEMSEPKFVVPATVCGMSGIGGVELTDANKLLLDDLMASAGGSPAWRMRKRAEGHDLIALGQVAPHRLSVIRMDLCGELRAALLMQVPVACLAHENFTVPTIIPMAMLELRYFEEAVRHPQPGYSFVQIREPRRVWSAHVSRDQHQAVCLGAEIPANIHVSEIVAMTYAALSMQGIKIDEGDSAGVLNAVAARWWQSNLARIPLSHTPFLCVDPVGETGAPPA
jgi:hypothetical protein